MKAAYIESTGSPDVIRYGDLPTPTPKQGEVLVRVGAVGRQPDRPVRPGRHGADAAAVPVHPRLRPGRHGRGGRPRRERASSRATACGAPTRGCSAGRARSRNTPPSSEDWLYPTPAGVTDVQAAAAALVGITAHLGLFRERQTAGRARSFSSTAARAASGRWWCRWPRRSAPTSSPRSARRRRRSCAAPGARTPCFNYKTQDVDAGRAGNTPRARASTSGTRRSASRISCGRWT